MKVDVWDFIKTAVIVLILMVLLLYSFIGAVLQESYKLNPLTEEEMVEVEDGK